MDTALEALLVSLPEDKREAALARLSDRDADSWRHDWNSWARPSQLPPEGDWRVWLLLAGRGFGKTRSGAEWVSELVKDGAARRVALVAPTASDARDVMVEGVSGVLTISPPDRRPLYEPSKRRLTWPNGARASLYSADEPERLRGPQFDAAWCDELAAWRYPEAWDMLMLGLRLGAHPRAVVTTTPKPVPLIRALFASPDCKVTRGTTLENAANLAPSFLAAILGHYAGTRLGRQELDAELLEDAGGALWSRECIERGRVARAPQLRRIVVAIDPAASASESADETGIVVAGLGQDGAFYVLDDLSGRYRPREWAARAVAAFHGHAADRIVAEVKGLAQAAADAVLAGTKKAIVIAPLLALGLGALAACSGSQQAQLQTALADARATVAIVQPIASDAACAAQAAANSTTEILTLTGDASGAASSATASKVAGLLCNGKPAGAAVTVPAALAPAVQALAAVSAS